jgi:hypothetical protein
MTKYLWAILFLFLYDINSAFSQNVELPLPEESNFIILARPALLSENEPLSELFPAITALPQLIIHLGLEPKKITGMTGFFQLDTLGIRKIRTEGFIRPGKNDGYMIVGDFKIKNVFKILKSKGWIEKDFPEKKLLWWSTGTFLLNENSGIFMTEFGDSKILIGGSEEVLRKMMDIKMQKRPGKIKSHVLDDLITKFNLSGSHEAGLYLEMTPEALTALKRELQSNINRHRWLGTISQNLNQIKECRAEISSADETSHYNFNALMSSPNSAAFISGLVNVTKGMLNGLFPENERADELLQNLEASSNESTLNLQSYISR